MLDLDQRTAKAIAWKMLRKQLRYAEAGISIAKAIDDQADVRPHRSDIGDLTEDIRAAVLIDRDSIHVGKRDAGLLQAIADRFGRESGPVLDSAQPLLFHGGNKLTVTNDTSRRIRMKYVEAKNDQVNVPISG